MTFTQETEWYGLLFRSTDGDTWNILSLTYGYVIGTIEWDDGPGWILKLDPGAKFIDAGDLRTMHLFIEDLPDPDEVYISSD